MTPGEPALLSEAELEAWGREIGRGLRPPAFLALRGELGAGKSVLARAVARGAGVSEAVPSPTYNLLLRYEAPARTEVVHIDLYRIADPEELGELGWDELPAEHELVLVEWPEKAGGRLPVPRWEIRLGRVSGSPDLRRVEARRVGDAPGLPGLPTGVGHAGGGA